MRSIVNVIKISAAFFLVFQGDGFEILMHSLLQELLGERYYLGKQI